MTKIARITSVPLQADPTTERPIILPGTLIGERRTSQLARLFNRASSQYLEIAQPVLTTTPISMACWFYSDDLSVRQTLIEITDYDGSDEDEFSLLLRGDYAGDNIQAHIGAASSFAHADTTTGPSVNTWNHACAVFASSDDRRVYLNGGSKGTDTTNLTPTALSHTHISVYVTDSTEYYYLSGRAAEAAIWNVDLTDAEVAILARGYSPLFVRPQNLIAYWPLSSKWGDQDISGNQNNLVPVNSPTWTEGPEGIIYPKERKFYLIPPTTGIVVARPGGM